MERFVGHVMFTEDLPPSIADQALRQYINGHDEQLLLAYAYNKLVESGIADDESESSKYLVLAGINIVNCVAGAEVA